MVDRHISAVKAKHGPSLAKTTRSVLSGVCALACRYDALVTNPCREVARISTKPKRPPTALTAEELRRLHQWLSSDEQSIDRDLPDLVLFLVATGLRIGEALAVQWADFGLDEGTVEVRGTVLRLRAGGLVIKPSPKSAAGRRILELPSWAVIMLRRRQAEAVGEAELARQVFPAPVAGGVRDPSNTLKMMRQAFKRAGFDGVTSHYFRKTVATLMDEAGLSARSAADQLGHAKPSLTADIYMGRKKRATGGPRCPKISSSPDRLGSRSAAPGPLGTDSCAGFSAGRPAAPAMPRRLLGDIARGGPPDSRLDRRPCTASDTRCERGCPAFPTHP